MTLLVDRSPVSLLLGGQMQTTKVAVDKLTDSIVVRLRRPTTLLPLSWLVTGKVRVTIVMTVDGQEHRCAGQCSGGIRTLLTGEASEYVLKYVPPVRMVNGTPTRTGERSLTECSCYVLLECISGVVLTNLTVETSASPAPSFVFRNSVAFDAATDAQEQSGDGVISLTHTSTGTNRAVFAGVGNSASTPQTATSCTYAGVSMTNLWNSGDGSFIKSAGYGLAAQSTGAQTVQAAVAAGTDQFCLAVVSAVNVDQTTPFGSAVTSPTQTQTPSVTVASPGSSDLLVDFVVAGASVDDTSTAGSNQTKRTGELVNNTYFGTSTQSGADGGVMSWALNASPSFGTFLGAVAFKDVGGGGGGHTIATGQPSETDSAFSVGKTKLKTVGLNTESDSVLTAVRVRSYTVGIIAETDSALAIAKRAKNKAVGLNTETDSSLTARPLRARATGLASETDSAFSVSHLKRLLVGLASEVDVALSISGQAVIAVTQIFRRGLTYARAMLRRG